jgi:hypothetical protein
MLANRGSARKGLSTETHQRKAVEKLFDLCLSPQVVDRRSDKRTKERQRCGYKLALKLEIVDVGYPFLFTSTLLIQIHLEIFPAAFLVSSVKPKGSAQ